MLNRRRPPVDFVKPFFRLPILSPIPSFSILHYPSHVPNRKPNLSQRQSPVSNTHRHVRQAATGKQPQAHRQIHLQKELADYGKEKDLGHSQVTCPCISVMSRVWVVGSA
ncbi:hypothetical protein RchiOBHm_Chr1g0341221 [Rosa chinensis]|uniref:Uncharacterized protein n=1 Tax=Rosa chinensis TaxID=74649 RepID=A0A2P6SDN5_ROSCH|nr:hypothetical protein RchiOBHm_Chr1g0341221 [Rosa chinensis]